MGDLMEDVKMVNQASHDLVLKIGFLNDHEDKLLDQFMDTFDLVIVGDGSL